MGDKKDILYILLTVGLFGLIGLYLAFTQGQTLSNIVSLPFNRNNSKTEEPNSNINSTPQKDDSSENTNNDYIAKVSTNLGEIEIDLLEVNAPNSVESFVYLSESGYYNGTKFHRFIPNLFIQGGSRNTLTSDLSDDKLGNPGYVINDEINWKSLDLSEEKQKSLKDDGYSSDETIESIPMDKYAVAWASSEPNTNGSQFFILLGGRDDPKLLDLEGKHTVFGKVIKGQDLLDQISNMSVNLDVLEEPRTEKEILINSISIEKR